MSTLEVMVDSWELECCGGPLGIGARVEWGLLFLPDDGVGRQVDEVWSVELLPAPPGWSARLLTAGAVRATWFDRTRRLPPRGVHRLSGHLAATWHGGLTDDDPATTPGRIERIQVVEQRFELVPAPHGPGYVSVAAGATLRDVDTAPEGLRDRDPAEGATSYRADSGWLVDLSLDPVPSGG